jgi:hypothetical protein
MGLRPQTVVVVSYGGPGVALNNLGKVLTTFSAIHITKLVLVVPTAEGLEFPLGHCSQNVDIVIANTSPRLCRPSSFWRWSVQTVERRVGAHRYRTTYPTPLIRPPASGFTIVSTDTLLMYYYAWHYSDTMVRFIKPKHYFATAQEFTKKEVAPLLANSRW